MWLSGARTKITRSLHLDEHQMIKENRIAKEPKSGEKSYIEKWNNDYHVATPPSILLFGLLNQQQMSHFSLNGFNQTLLSFIRLMKSNIISKNGLYAPEYACVRTVNSEKVFEYTRLPFVSNIKFKCVLILSFSFGSKTAVF